MFKSNGHRICRDCGKEMFVEKQFCQQCRATVKLISNSGNKNIDHFIENTRSKRNTIEWVPFHHLHDVEYIAKGGFSQIYKATWGKKNPDHITGLEEQQVVLKVLNNSQNVDKEFLNELKLTYQFKSEFVIKCYGVTQDPRTKNYALILKYAPDGNLHHYLSNNFEKLTWIRKPILFKDIIFGIKELHKKGIIHRDLHSGNILIFTESRNIFDNSRSNNFETAVISDLGFSQLVTVNSENSKNSKKPQMYGVIPYMAPELFKGEPYTFASDIYSLGMIMWELTTGHKPFYDREHGPILILDILDGKRPVITKDTPECWAKLMKKCWHSDPSQRPKIDEIIKLFSRITNYYNHHYYSEYYVKKYYADIYDIWPEYKEAEKARLVRIKSKKPFVNNNPNSRYYSVSLDSMLESINSLISGQFSIDSFDIMNMNSKTKPFKRPSIEEICYSLRRNDFWLTTDIYVEIFDSKI
ncbi:hypothetical protein Glove_853g9 [Diversispora epigaea]|uniref:Protein kinase domain-containing protein n=1 Tax=Diversispora epigaea TaxID=1348612 RepID=A0A397FYI2_9GLOM|nr:hypothetical protein Glove_853g9 [Diversispora epigaea]